MHEFPDRPFLDAFLAPYLRRDGNDVSVTREGIRRLARELHGGEREVMAGLLRRGLWPARFSRSRGALPAEGLARLLETRVLVAGCGGLGGHAAELLARMGVGALTLCDPDRFEESNLNRQRFCTEATLGAFKAEVCRDGILASASYMDVEARVEALDEDNLPGFLAKTDAVMDCLDSLARKSMLEQAARKAGVLCVQAAVARNEGLCLVDDGQAPPFSRVCPGEEAGNREGAPMNAHALTVTGTACLMVALLVRRLCAGKNDAGTLFHLDMSLPELERFALSPLPEAHTL